MELAIALALLAIVIAAGAMLGRRLRAAPGTIGASVPPESLGVVQAPLAPLGTVHLAGETWSARTADERHLDRGTKVRLAGFEGLVAIVEPVAGEEPVQPAAIPSPPMPSAPTPSDPR